jgi:5-methylcytosine-specific restriction protein B
LFDIFTESDFKSLNGTKTFDENEIKVVKEKLKNLRYILSDEISKKWGAKFKATSGRTSASAKIHELLINLTQEPGSGYLSYPRFNIIISSSGLKTLFRIDKLNTHYEAKPFFKNFVKNSETLMDFFAKHEINISSLDLETDYFDSSDYIDISHKYSEIVGVKGDKLVEIILNDLQKLVPLYNAAVTGLDSTVEIGVNKTAIRNSNNCSILNLKKQIILYGPPGTGKTYQTKQSALEIILMGVDQMLHLTQDEINQQYEELKNNGQIDFITFHPSFSYEEFVEGITIDVETTGDATKELKYKLKHGIFKQVVIKAITRALDPDQKDEELKKPSLTKLMMKYRDEIKLLTAQTNNSKEKLEIINEWWAEKPRFVLIIDEINRGDMSKIFGELITLLEADKRIGMENELTAKLPYSQEEFGVPPNLYVVGTMNTADKSIALIDVALRRRFGFIEMSPNLKILEQEHIVKNQEKLKTEQVYDGLVKSKDALIKINNGISSDSSVGRDKQIGHSFLFKVDNQQDLILVWRNEILPLLEEYYYGQYNKINYLLFGKEGDTDWITQMGGISNFSNYAGLMSFLDTVNQVN